MLGRYRGERGWGAVLERSRGGGGWEGRSRSQAEEMREKGAECGCRVREASLTPPHPPRLPRSPISSLPTLFDQTVSCSSSGQLENVPQATPNIEQLLEKQGNGEAGVNSESLGARAAGGEVPGHGFVRASWDFARGKGARLGTKR